MMDRTVSSSTSYPHASRSACTRRYPYVSSDSVKLNRTSSVNSARRRARCDGVRVFQEWNPDRETCAQTHIFEIG